METDKLTFKLQELPEQESQRTVDLQPGDLELEDSVTVNEGSVYIYFFRATDFIEVKFELKVLIDLVCDRSLKLFTKEVTGSYQILFEPEPEEIYETEKSAVKKISIEDLTISITKEVRDTIMLGIPVKKLHPDYYDENGKPTDFGVKTFGSKDEDEDSIDPRWSELKKLK